MEKLYEGKVKIFYFIEDLDVLLIIFKDDVIVFNV